MKIVFGEKHSGHLGIKRVEMFVEKRRGGRNLRDSARNSVAIFETTQEGGHTIPSHYPTDAEELYTIIYVKGVTHLNN